MISMPGRRFFLLGCAGLAGAMLRPPLAHADQAGDASQFIRQAGDQLLAVVNGPGSTAQQRPAMARIIDNVVDVNGVAKFCLGRFWRMATPAQQQQYVQLFHQVLVTSITGRIGEYRGVQFKILRAVPRADGTVVETELDRPNNPPTKVQWVVQKVNGSLRIVDVIAEGTSLRLTQRSDYASYLTRNQDSIPALIAAMQHQIQQNAG
ncbi:MAG: ABC transporter substrate-binding protein [Rhodospirillales bacterium]|nr:ABC transporter substrate-binding protein [Rhodospirillales bacterium]